MGIDEVHSSNITLGRAFVKSHHGILPIPAPATLELLKDCPVAISEIGSELVTPTGAGILKALSRGFGWMPEMKISHIGYGAGSRELVDRPNFLRVLIGDAGGPFKQERVFVIEANIDDMSPQVFEYLFERLFKEGALDVYVSTIQMKKTRPAFKLSALAEPAKLERLAAVIFNETTTIGVRFHEAGRFKLERRSVRVKTRFGEVGVKLSKAPADGMLTVSPEYDECARIARAKKIPFKAIHDEAVAAARRMI